MAYFSDSAVDRSSTSDASTSVTASTSHLSFRDRPRRRLRVSFVLDSGDSESEPQIWASSSTSERWDERGTPRDENQDSDTDVANDPLGDIKGKGKQKEATREVDDELSAAQNELLDEELFAEVCARVHPSQAPRLAPLHVDFRMVGCLGRRGPLMLTPILSSIILLLVAHHTRTRASEFSQHYDDRGNSHCRAYPSIELTFRNGEFSDDALELPLLIS